MKNKRGSALMIVIMAFAVLMTLGTAVLAVSLAETKQVIHQEDRIKAHYAARSGAEAMASYLIKNPTEVANVISLASVNPATGTIDGRDFSITVSGSVSAPLITSKVYQTINGTTTEVGSVRLSIKETTANLLDYSVFSNLKPKIGKDHKGNVGTNADDVDIANHTKKIDGDVTIVGEQSDADAIQDIVLSGNTVSPIVNPVQIPTIKEAEFPALLDPDTSRNLPDGTTGIINNGAVTKYRIPSIDLNGNNDFTVSGGGTIHLFVTGTIALGGNCEIICASGTKLVLYSNQAEIIFNGAPSLNCVLYAPNASVTITGAGNGSYVGQVICDKFDGGNSGASSFTSAITMNDLLINPAVAGFKRNIYGK